MEEGVRKVRHGARSFLARRAAALDAFEEIESEDPEALRQKLAQAAFGSDHPYARSIIGTTQSLNDLELQEVMDHQHLVFATAGATLLVVGDVKPGPVIAASETMFENWEGGNAPVPAVPPPALPRNPREIAFLDRHTASTLLTCATRPLPEVAGTNAALRVLVAVLGQGVESRLNLVLRENNGLTYGAYAEIVRRRQASALIACSPLQGSRADLGVRLFRGVLEGMRVTPATDDELRRAQAALLSELASALEDRNRGTHKWRDTHRLGDRTPRMAPACAGRQQIAPHQ